MSDLQVVSTPNQGTLYVPPTPSNNSGDLSVVSSPSGTGANVNLQASGSIPTNTVNTQSGGYDTQIAGGVSQAPAVTPNTVNVKNPGVPITATLPHDLSAKFGVYNGTVYNEATNTPYSDAADFFKDAGIDPSTPWSQIKLNAGYIPVQPQTQGPPAPAAGSSYSPNANTSPNVYSAASNATFTNPGQFDSGVNSSPNIPADSLTDPTSGNDIQQMIADNMKQQDQLLQNIANYAMPSADELSAKTDLLNLENNYAQGSENIMEKNIPLEFQQGQQAAVDRQYGISQNAAANTYNALAQNREAQLQGAQTLFDATQNKLQNTINLYKSVAPTSLGTQYNSATGDLFTVTQNPLTGQIQVAQAGNIGPQKSYASSSVETDPNTGQLIFVGVGADGTITQTPLGSGSGTGATAASGASGAVTAPGVSTASQLINYYVHGNANTTAAYATTALAQAGIDPNTPVSQISTQQVPQLAAAIATNESNYNAQTGTFGGNVNTNVGARTNNPGNIEWATATAMGYDKTFGATPYKSPNGITYAKFSTPQVGFQALQSYLSQNIAGSGTSATQANPPPAQLAPAVKSLSDGTQFIDSSLVQNNAMANNYAAKTGLPILSADQTKMVQSIDTTQQKLGSLTDLINQQFGSGVLGKVTNFLGGNIGSIFGGTEKDTLNEFRTTALNTIEDLAGGSGSGLRLSQPEISQAISNLPTLSDSKEQALNKVQWLNTFLNTNKSELLPNFNANNQSPTIQSASSGQDATAMLDQMLAEAQQQ